MKVSRLPLHRLDRVGKGGGVYEWKCDSHKLCSRVSITSECQKKELYKLLDSSSRTPVWYCRYTHPESLCFAFCLVLAIVQQGALTCACIFSYITKEFVDMLCHVGVNILLRKEDEMVTCHVPKWPFVVNMHCLLCYKAEMQKVKAVLFHLIKPNQPISLVLLSLNILLFWGILHLSSIWW